MEYWDGRKTLENLLRIETGDTATSNGDVTM